MHRFVRTAALVAITTTASMCAFSAGSVEVSAADVQRFRDFGASTLQTQGNLRTLTDFLTRLAPRH